MDEKGDICLLQCFPLLPLLRQFSLLLLYHQARQVKHIRLLPVLSLPLQELLLLSQAPVHICTDPLHQEALRRLLLYLKLPHGRLLRLPHLFHQGLSSLKSHLCRFSLSHLM